MRATRLTSAAMAAAIALGACSVATAPPERTLTPTPIPWSAPDVDNPLRGQYVWDPLTRWSAAATQAPTTFPQSSPNAANRDRSPAWPAVSTYYTRVSWADLEASAGTRSGGFPRDTVLERRIAAAAARGQRTIFRVMMADPETYSAQDERLYPDYLAGQVGEWRARVDGGRRMYVPDWNSPAYLAGVERLVAELGRRYDADPRVVGFDISGYGTWGEWNAQVWGPQLPPGRTELTEASMRTIVDATVRAFPTTTLFALTDPALMRYALTRSPHVGLRVDCLGQWSGGGAWERILAVPGADTRWRTAPVASEFCPTNYGTEQAGPVVERLPGLREDVTGDLYANAARQVARWHVSLVSSGNHPGAGDGATLTPRQLADFTAAAKRAGYRYSTPAVRVPQGTVPAGSTMTVRTTWANAGSAPATFDTTVELALRAPGSTTAVTRTRSAVDLRDLAEATPAPGGEPAVARTETTDHLPVPTAPGRYDLVAVVRAQVSGRPTTLALAQQGRTRDGAYLLGQVDVTR